jgi:uncharacterized membrane protein HdeD (DUF308 family)
MCAAVAKTGREIKIAENEIKEPPEKQPRCCGRKVSLCTSTTANTLFSIALIVGAILLIAGVLGLVGHFSPPTGASAALQSIRNGALLVATHLSSDLFTLSMFTTAIGTAFTLTGAVSLLVNRQQLKKA